LSIVIKPSRGWDQRGVSKVELASELESAFVRAKEASAADVVLVEEFIDSCEFSVNAYTIDGVTKMYSVTKRVITQYPDPPGITFAEWFPSGLDTGAETKAIAAAIAGVRALGIRRGPSYTQLRVGSKGAKLIETAHRLGGGLDPDVALLASGQSLYRKILGVALGRPDWEHDAARFDPPSQAIPGLAREGERHGGAIGKFLVGSPGRVVAIRGLDNARTMPGVVSAEVYVSVGGSVQPLTDGSKRAGHVLAFGDTREEAQRRACDAAALIHIDTIAES
jgi:biotin carboxylase